MVVEQTPAVTAWPAEHTGQIVAFLTGNDMPDNQSNGARPNAEKRTEKLVQGIRDDSVSLAARSRTIRVAAGCGAIMPDKGRGKGWGKGWSG